MLYNFRPLRGAWSMSTSIGILGLGMSLPRDVRRNTWWPAETIARWTAQPVIDPPDAIVSSDDSVAAALRSQVADPFQGSFERRVLGSDESLLDLELGAARAAIERSGVERDWIDLLLTDSLARPALATNWACNLHHHLGLRSDCFALQTEGTQHAFLLQLSIAEAMITSGRAHYALLIQSSGASRILDYNDPLSVIFGDGATAAIIGPVANGFGILAVSHRTDGAQANTMIASVPGGTWYDAGRAYLHITDRAAMKDILYRTIERAEEVVAAVLSRSGVRAEDVAVFAMYQGVSWLQRMVQERVGLERARTIDVFHETGNLFGASMPSVLTAAEKRNLLRPGDLVVTVSGGSGMTYGAAVMRWGRA